MNRTKIIEHYKKFMQLDKMQEDYQIDIDWMQAFIEDNNLVNKNDLLPVVSGSLPPEYSNLLKAAKKAYVAIRHETNPSNSQLDAYFEIEKAVKAIEGNDR